MEFKVGDLVEVREKKYLKCLTTSFSGRKAKVLKSTVEGHIDLEFENFFEGMGSLRQICAPQEIKLASRLQYKHVI